MPIKPTVKHLDMSPKGMPGVVGRQLRLCTFGLMATLLASCSTMERAFEGAGAEALEFNGGVVSDDPAVSSVGRDVIKAGGKAADAATAMAFALTVTLPSSASLGGGGVCVVAAPDAEKVEVIEFLPRGMLSTVPGAERPAALPGTVRGLFALHARYGGLPWSQLVAPAESMARFGHTISRQLASDFLPVEAALLSEVGPRKLYTRLDGRGAKGEGDTVIQAELAGILSAIRRDGPKAFYNSEWAAEFLAEAQRKSAPIRHQEFEAYVPRWMKPVTIEIGGGALHFAPPPAAAGVVAAQIVKMIDSVDLGFFEDADADESAHLFLEAAMRAYADRAGWLREDWSSTVSPAELVSKAHIKKLIESFDEDRHTPATELHQTPVVRTENPTATTFAAMDRDGGAVSCAMTLNNRFGVGRMSKGVMLAAMPGPSGRGPTSLGPMVGTSEDQVITFIAGAASGGVAAPTALVQAGYAALTPGKTIEEALSVKRLHHSGAPDIAYHEQGYPEDVLEKLRARGHRTAPTQDLGVVNVIVCKLGMPSAPDSCLALADPRGHGLGMGVYIAPSFF